jgi:hypothetical protein
VSRDTTTDPGLTCYFAFVRSGAEDSAFTQLSRLTNTLDGLQGTRRAAQVSGDCSITAAADSGTRVYWTAPLP